MQKKLLTLIFFLSFSVFAIQNDTSTNNASSTTAATATTSVNPTAETSTNTTQTSNSETTTTETTNTAESATTMSQEEYNAKIQEFKAQLADIESKLTTDTTVATQTTTTQQQLQAELKKDETRYANLGERLIGIRQEAPATVPGFGTKLNFGINSSEEGGEVLIAAPNVNKHYNILLQNQFANSKLGAVSVTGSRVIFSGYVAGSYEASANPFGQFEEDDQFSQPEQKSDVYASGAFDLTAQVNDWVTGYGYFFAGSEPGQIQSLGQTFIVVGNLDKFPIYGSAGREYISSGRFYSNMLTASLPFQIGRFRANDANIGGVWRGFRLNGFVYDNERELLNEPKKELGQWGAELEFFSHRSPFFKQYVTNPDITVTTGVAFVNDMSAVSSVSTGDVLPLFFPIKQYIPAGNVFAKLNYARWTFYTEFQQNFKAFQPDEISMNGKGAKLGASTYEISYDFFLKWPSWVAVNYSQSRNTLALQLPERQYGVTYGVGILPNTYLSAQFLILDDYSEDNSAFAAGSFNPGGIILGSGDKNKQVIASLDVYF